MRIESLLPAELSRGVRRAGELAAPGVAASTPVGRIAPVAPAGLPGEGRTALEHVARLIARLGAARPPVAEAPDDAWRPPVLAAPPSGGAEVAVALQRALSESGLAYERHLAQWAEGRRPTQDLLREPQARLPAPREAPVHEQALPLVQQQLDVLDTGQLAWHGQLTQGVHLAWQLETRVGMPRDAAPGRLWATALRVDMPRLGRVEAALTLGEGGALEISLSAEDGDTQARLRGAFGELAQSLAARGLAPSGLKVQRGR